MKRPSGEGRDSQGTPLKDVNVLVKLHTLSYVQGNFRPCNFHCKAILSHFKFSLDLSYLDSYADFVELVQF